MRKIFTDLFGSHVQDVKGMEFVLVVHETTNLCIAQSLFTTGPEAFQWEVGGVACFHVVGDIMGSKARSARMRMVAFVKQTDDIMLLLQTNGTVSWSQHFYWYGCFRNWETIGSTCVQDKTCFADLAVLLDGFVAFRGRLSRS